MRRQVLLQPGPSLDAAIRRLEEAFDGVEERAMLAFEHAYAEEGPGTTLHIWREQVDNEALVTLADDTELFARYVIVEAVDDQAATAILEEIGKRLALVPLDELKQQARERRASDPAALVRLAIAVADGYVDDEVAQIIERARDSDEPAVRDAADTAAGLLNPQGGQA